jgi:hypothetical protein
MAGGFALRSYGIVTMPRSEIQDNSNQQPCGFSRVTATSCKVRFPERLRHTSGRASTDAGNRREKAMAATWKDVSFRKNSYGSWRVCHL